ncbi:MAG: serine/threonine protein kinase [Deltaproteobacteria bacterium]|nr:serine/threonine protein kinase [Deltaproteobacteria bacterium]
MNPETALLPCGTVVGEKYRIESPLGQGGMGAVYLAENLAIGRRVAIKVLLPRFAADPEVLVRFRNEARAASAIHHPGIVEMLDMGQTASGETFLVMEHLPGESLGVRLRRSGRMDLATAAWLIAQLLDAIAAAHEQGIVHRDLKPDNVCLVEGPRAAIKVLDFGVSKFHDQREASVTNTSTVLGTPAYMSPEQARSAKRAGPAADLYAVGAILYEALAGSPAFEGKSHNEIIARVLTQPHRPLRILRADIPESVARFVDTLLSKAPEDRPASAREANALLSRALLEASRAAGSSPSARPSATPRLRRLGWVLGGLVLGGAVTASLVLQRASPALVFQDVDASAEQPPAPTPAPPTAAALPASDLADAASNSGTPEPAALVQVRLVADLVWARFTEDDEHHRP